MADKHREALEKIRDLFEANPKFKAYSEHNLCDAHTINDIVRPKKEPTDE